MYVCMYVCMYNSVYECVRSTNSKFPIIGEPGLFYIDPILLTSAKKTEISNEAKNRLLFSFLKFDSVCIN